MKVRYMSDLHLEFGGVIPDFVEPVGEDLVVLAGDIHVGTRGIRWANTAFAGRPTVYVLGNHEFYDEDWEKLLGHCRDLAAPHVHVLEDSAVAIGGLTVLGCTLWTDFAFHGAETEVAARQAARGAMVDYWVIRDGTGRLSPERVLQRHRQSERWLRNEIAHRQGPILVVTHHSPSAANVNPRFGPADELSPCFHSKLDGLADSNKIVAWINGHHHHSSVVRFGPGAGVALLSNQRGYPSEFDVRKQFRWDALIDIPIDGSMR